MFAHLILCGLAAFAHAPAAAEKTTPNPTPPLCISGIINTYTPVTGLGCDNSVLQVGSTSGFGPGDKVLIVQMQVPQVDLSNTAAFGTLLDTTTIGNYEFNRIQSIAGNQVQLQFKLTRPYDFGGRVQLVRVPEYTDVAVCNLTCAPWNGTTGGILALSVAGTLTLQGHIDVSQKGFRGGQVETQIIPWVFGEQQYFYPPNSQVSAAKGEGIVLIPVNQSFGRGRAGNGGGGGNAHNGGGGGGGNAGAGGNGGREITNLPAFPTPNTDGVGGERYFPLNRNKILLGGAGGAGHANDQVGTSGGRGAGIVVIVAGTIQANGYKIIANGEDIAGGNNWNDGQGGGGAGGTVAIEAQQVVGTLNCELKGGAGGSNPYVPAFQLHGPGGGGGGGKLLISQNFPTLVVNLNGGLNGLSSQGYTNGALAGLPGRQLAGLAVPQGSVPAEPTWAVDVVSPACGAAGSSGSLTVVQPVAASYRLGTGAWQPSPAFTGLAPGTYLVQAQSAGGCLYDTTVVVAGGVPVGLALLQSTAATCASGGALEVAGSAGTPPYQYALDGGSMQPGGLFADVAAGLHTIVVSDAAGCTQSGTYTIDATPAVALTLVNVQAAPCSGNGAIDVSASAGTPPYQFALGTGGWQPGGAFANVPAGTHTIRVLDAAGCVDSASYTVASTAAVADTLVALQAATCTAGGQAQIAGVAGTPPYEYAVDGGGWQSTGLFSNLSSGTHAYSVRDAAGCLTSNSFAIGLNSTLYDSLIALQGPSCNAGGQLSLTAAGGLEPYEFQLDGGAWQPAGLFADLPAGVYSVALRDAAGCTDTATFDLPAPLPVTDSLVTIMPSGCTVAGALTVVATAGLPPFEYQLDGGAWQSSGAFAGLVAGAHQVVVRDAAGCTDLGVYTIDALPPVADTLLAAQNATCLLGGALTVAALAGTPPYQYAVNGGSPQPTGTFTDLPPGTYTIAVGDAAGCTATSDYTIAAPPPVTDSLLLLTAATCVDGAALTVDGLGGTPPYEFSLDGGAWQPGGAFTGVAAGAHVVVVRDAAGCADTSLYTVAAPAGLSLALGSVQAATCVAGGQLAVTAMAGTPPYQFSLDGGAWQSGSTFADLPPGVHAAAVQDAAGCTYSETFTIDAPPPVTVSLLSLQNASCVSGGSIVVEANGGTAPFEYALDGGAWQPGGNFVDVPAGIHQAIVRDAAGCADSASHAILAAPPLSDTLVALTVATCVAGATLEVAAVGGTPPFVFALDGGPGQPAGSFADVPAGAHQVEITDAAGCTVAAMYTVASTSDVSAQLVQTQDATCVAGGQLEVAGAAGTPPYEYALDGGAWQSAGLFGNVAAGAHNVVVRDAAGCSFSVNAMIGAAPAVLDSLVSVQNATCVAAGQLTITAVGGTAPFEFQLAGGAWQSAGVFIDLPAGSYSVVVRDAAGCTHTADYTVPGAPTPADSLVLLADETCGTPGALTVTGTAGTPPYQYALDGGAWQPAGAFGALAAGTYTLTIGDAAGCTAVASYTIGSAPTAPAPDISLLVTCTDGSITVSHPLATGFRLDGGAWQAAPVFAALLPGTYQLEVQYPGGCVFDTTLTLVAPNAANQTLVQLENAGCASGGSLTVAGGAGTPPYAYALGSGSSTGAWQPTGTFTNLAPGVYTVAVQDAAQCTSVAYYTIAAPPPVILTLETLIPVDCRHDAGAFTVSASGGVAAYSYVLDNGMTAPTGQFAPVGVGDYTVTATDQEGCTASLTVSIDDLSGDTARTYETVTIYEGDYFGLPDGRHTARAGEYAFYYENTAGCDSAHVITLLVVERNVYVPNIFAPDSNGPNRFFTVYANESLHVVRRLAVYDRWGELVFERRDLAPNDEANGWSGVFRGRPVLPGAFVWLAELEFVDGKSIRMQGDVTVVR